MRRNVAGINIMVFGTFDIFHPGHRSFLIQAKKKGDYLIAVVARDKTVVETKKQATRNKEKVRWNAVKESGLADKVILGSLWDKYAAIKKYQPDIICLGYDQKYFIAGLKERLEKIGLKKTELFRLKAYKPEIYKSSKLRKLI